MIIYRSKSISCLCIPLLHHLFIREVWRFPKKNFFHHEKVHPIVYCKINSQFNDYMLYSHIFSFFAFGFSIAVFGHFHIKYWLTCWSIDRFFGEMVSLSWWLFPGDWPQGHSEELREAKWRGGSRSSTQRYTHPLWHLPPTQDHARYVKAATGTLRGRHGGWVTVEVWHVCWTYCKRCTELI